MPFRVLENPAPKENLVHNMEHGQIVLWYSPDLTAEEKDQVEEMVNDEPAATVATLITTTGSHRFISARKR